MFFFYKLFPEEVFGFAIVSRKRSAVFSDCIVRPRLQLLLDKASLIRCFGGSDDIVNSYLLIP